LLKKKKKKTFFNGFLEFLLRGRMTTGMFETRAT